MQKPNQNKQKGKETKEEILVCARTFFFSRGYDSTSVQDIIDELGIAKGTFYHHFNSKEELLMELIKTMSDELTKELLQNVESRTPKNTLDKLKIIQELHFDWMDKNPEMIFFFIKALYLPQNLTLKSKLEKEIFKRDLDFMSDLIVEGQKDGSFNVDMPAPFLAESILAMSYVQNERFAFFMLGIGDVSAESIYENSVHSYEIFSKILGIKKAPKLPFSKEEMISAALKLRTFAQEFEKQNSGSNEDPESTASKKKGGKRE
ncbi:TetR/AcrR family transcriptional regulator [Leptospira gomenensis]|uniref:TetR/AcrR family transcriptional regulator n=1 Tax=Leptospira gomenensis TaxID=2484974 RepID=A0A5F1YF20_9LEPT|nr:TetR/AcrR family transcriptional regulator [Leptospira gomenensis]TGK36441.1 TetR/AcrR family transcriptional regulator [Leptospira gomenensis]TGK38270.1 TetR/AcrR family transcriptional regulator [Leptospira gomenensis]TGK46011.1 TetR/AcrR family transcriptional regulator [Leptospira gomenensis]TGK65275.1 TetR/AcrR family transcriptional regulator [Leptospira gomenensis]